MNNFTSGACTRRSVSFFRRAACTFGILTTLACTNGFAALTYLHTQGEDMVNEQGNKVLLQGLGLGNWMLPEGYMWKFGDKGDRPRKIEAIVSDLIGPDNAARFWAEFRNNYITEADIQRIKELGFNSVRPALNARLFLTEGENPVYKDEGFELLDNLVKWCKKNDIYVIIDMHGAPGGQTGSNIDDSANDKPELFTNPKNQERLIELWVKIATRYKDEPTVAAYDLLNEPLPERTGAAAKHKTELEPLYKRITQTIRAVDKKHMITVEGCNWANDWSVFSDRFDDNMFYQFHFYCWDRPTHLNGIGQYLKHRDRLKAPVWAGETGEKDNAIYWATTQYFEQNNIGWSFWPWKKMDTVNTPYSIHKPDGWDAIRAYSQGKEKPSQEVAQKALDQLLQNIRLENCVYFPDVVNAMFRRVPGKIEAENYGHDGANKSFCVKDVTQKSKYYRTSEPVPVVQVEGQERRQSGQAVSLHAEEWTAYLFNSLDAREYAVSVKISAENPPVQLQVCVNDHTEDVTVSETGWKEIALKPVAVVKGKNSLKVLVKSGTANIDWVELK